MSQGKRVTTNSIALPMLNSLSRLRVEMHSPQTAILLFLSVNADLDENHSQGVLASSSPLAVKLIPSGQQTAESTPM